MTALSLPLLSEPPNFQSSTPSLEKNDVLGSGPMNRKIALQNLKDPIVSHILQESGRCIDDEDPHEFERLLRLSFMIKSSKKYKRQQLISANQIWHQEELESHGFPSSEKSYPSLDDFLPPFDPSFGSSESIDQSENKETKLAEPPNARRKRVSFCDKLIFISDAPPIV
jgi:hypothetical protein